VREEEPVAAEKDERPADKTESALETPPRQIPENAWSGFFTPKGQGFQGVTGVDSPTHGASIPVHHFYTCYAAGVVSSARAAPCDNGPLARVAPAAAVAPPVPSLSGRGTPTTHLAARPPACPDRFDSLPAPHRNSTVPPPPRRHGPAVFRNRVSNRSGENRHSNVIRVMTHSGVCSRNGLTAAGIMALPR
jgi:hypothetical protein